MFKSLENRVAFRMVWVAVITVCVASVSLYCTSRLFVISSQVRHSHEIIQKLKDIKYLLKEAESGQRGFLLTGGNEDYLAPYQTAVKVSGQRLEELSRMIGDSSSPTARVLDVLAPLIRTKFKEMDETLRNQKIGLHKQAIELVQTNQGERIMGQIDSFVDRAELLEQSHLDESAWDAVVVRSLKVFLDVVGALFTVLILIAVYLVVGREMTERKKVEHELACARDEAEAASRAKGDFMANVSHEIRTPMNAILGMTELTLETELVPQQRENLQIVKSATDSLLAIINDLLDFSKMEAGKLSLGSEDFGLRDHLADTLGLLGLKAVDKGLELSCRVDTEVPDRISGDPSRLRQILVNLVGNAIKFTETGDVIVEVKIANRFERTVELHFRVTDTGIGVPREKREMIFAPFTQADGSTTRLYGGTGLGLTISTQLVALMGGRLWVESAQGIGSTFHFTAKFTEGLSETTLKHESLNSLRGLRVLVVDDNAVNRRILEEILIFWQLVPTLVDSGHAAILELARARDAEEPYSLVLLDALMPGLDGFAVAQRIKTDLELNTTVILMLTSSDRQGFADMARSAGIAACLNKPIHQNKLLDAVLEAFNQTPKTDPPVEPGNAIQARERQLRILMAEDNLHNQRVAILILAKSGHAVTVVANGLEAVEAVKRGTYDLVLMDLQMPRMDGLQATAAIRAAEVGTSRRLPIIAMTAHAMKEDQDRCYAAGMDGYVSKPIHAEIILKTIKDCIDRLGPAPVPAMAGNDGTATAEAIDFVAALDRVDGDRAFLAEMAGMLAEEMPVQMAEIREALALGRPSDVIEPAHKLKNWAGNFVAESMFAALARLEAQARAGRIDGAVAAFPELEREAERLSSALARLDSQLSTMMAPANDRR